MPNNYISINPSSRLGANLMMSVQSLIYGQDMIQNLLDAMTQMINGADYSQIEAAFGVPTGKGQTLYNLVSGSLNDLKVSTNVPQLLSWLAACRP